MEELVWKDDRIPKLSKLIWAVSFHQRWMSLWLIVSARG
jgi:hypothetical protein